MKQNIFCRLLLLATLLLTTLTGRAQSADNLMLPGANAYSLTSTLSTHAGLHTGDLQVELPLLTLPGKGIDIPISLAFSSGGVDHTTEASCIGLGWSLKAGGVITGIINGEDDWEISSISEVPWQYNINYLEELHRDNTYNPNLVAGQIEAIGNMNNNPDSYRYALPDGRSGDIFVWLDSNDTRHIKMYPDNDCIISRTTNGFLITDGDGIKYYFETKESNGTVLTSCNTAWFLSRIVTPEGGNVTFSYADESYTDYRVERDYHFPNTIDSKRLTCISSDFGYVLFNSEWRIDMDDAEEITSIELYRKNGTLIKGFGLTHDYIETSYEESPNYEANWRVTLNGVYEYDAQKNALPGYTFTYDYYFTRGKDSYKLCNDPSFHCMRGTWASPARYVAIVDRNEGGNPACWGGSAPGISQTFGFTLIDDNWDLSLDDYFSLIRIDLPTGGYESYSYEEHTYHYSGESKAAVDSKDVGGKRLSKKVVSSSDGSPSVTYNYIYKLHNADYSLTNHSSGILVNPSIHTSALYTPLKDQGHDRLVATAVTTEKPQNSLDVPAVCYTEVEESVTNASGTPISRTIYYLGRYNLSPAMNYFYSNYRYSTSYSASGMLVKIPNQINGSLDTYPEGYLNMSGQDFTYMAYPVGQFYDESSVAGKVEKQIFLNGSDRVVRKVENDYTTYYPIIRYGYQIEKYNENGNFRNFGIARTVHGNKHSRLIKSTTTDYFPLEGSSVTDSIVTIQEYSDSGSRRYKQTVTVKGVSTIEEQRYPDQISMGSSTSLTGSALAVKQMRDKNVIGLPIQQTTKHNGVVQSSTYHTYKQLSNGMIVPDSVYRLKPSEAGTLSYPSVNAQGKMDKNAAYEYMEHYYAYSATGRPMQINRRGEAPVALYWGYNDRYVTARAENCIHYAIDSNANFKNYMAQLENFGTVTDSNRAAFNQLNRLLRQTLSTALLTTYTYDPLLGITSECNPSGDTIFYEYDSYGRLARTRNTNGEVIQEYEYHYAN